MYMGKGPCPLSLDAFLHSQNGWATECDGFCYLLQKNLSIYYKRRGSVPSVAVWGKAQLYPLSSCAPLPQKKKKKGSSLLQGTGTMQAGVVHQHILQLAFRKSSWVFG